MSVVDVPLSETTATSPGVLLRDYRPMNGVWDEMVDGSGVVRPHWRGLVGGLEALGPQELNRRWVAARRNLHDNALTYNVHSGDAGDVRLWELSPVPLVIPESEWRDLAAGLQQRARLLNALLADIYGPQRVLRDGLLPPALVLGNPQFLRPCHGVGQSGGVHLHMYAADLGRGPDGRWWVLSDRAQAPAGLGYALENRIVVARALPDQMRECHVHRLATFFRAWRETLLTLSGREDPRFVLLSPGPRDETYFEHVYLARYLGFTLVEGGDLTVRDDRVYVKNIDGLQQVDVILRRIDGEDADPLELQSEVGRGVPGLVQATRAGNVIVANAIGSGIIETRALMAFLPGLCRRLLGEELILPSVATWWCGDADARNYVTRNFDQLSFSPTFDSRRLLAKGDVAQVGRDHSPEERAARLDGLQLRGYQWAAQEPVVLSTSPVLSEDRLVPKPITVRAFLAAGDGGYQLLPGGLVRISESDEPNASRMRRGIGNMDLWIRADGAVDTFSMLTAQDRNVQLRRGGLDLPSRTADNLFWLGRYVERAEAAMRLLRALLLRRAESDIPVTEEVSQARLLQLLVEQGYLELSGETPDLEVELRRLLYAPDVAGGLNAVVANVMRIGEAVRDRLSLDAWRDLQHLHECIGEHRPTPDLDVGDALDLVNELIRTMTAFSGMAMENMTRGLVWRCLDMGRRLERAMQMADLLKLMAGEGEPERDGVLELLLELADSFMTYRTRYLTTPRLEPVLDLLLLDESNPRSVAFQLAALERHLANLPREVPRTVLTAEERILIRVRTDLRLADLPALCRSDRRGRRRELAKLLGMLSEAMPQLSDAIAGKYFSHAGSRHVDEMRRAEEPA